jgi:hypothetical protein
LRLTPCLNLSALVTCHILYFALTAWQNAVFLINSRLTPFTAAPPLRERHPFFQSYGTRLQSSFTRVHSCALVYSTHPPVSVYGTGTLVYTEVFLGRKFEKSSLAEAALSACAPATFNRRALSPPAFLCSNVGGAGILTSSPSSTPYGLDLGPD